MFSLEVETCVLGSPVLLTYDGAFFFGQFAPFLLFSRSALIEVVESLVLVDLESLESQTNHLQREGERRREGREGGGGRGGRGEEGGEEQIEV